MPHMEEKKENLGIIRPSVTIAIATHKPANMPGDPMYLPVQVGASLQETKISGTIPDDLGESISELNPYFSELTALYWLWKNCDSDYKGIVQYRRYFASPHLLRRHAPDRRKRVLTTDELHTQLEKSPILLPRKRHYVIETIYSHYDHTLHIEQLDKAREVLQDMHPEYLPAWDRLMASRSANLFNMMIMDRAHFDAYCTWLFPILFELIERVDPKQYDSFHARFPGRVSELLLNIWIANNNLPYAELPVTTPSPINWIKKGTGFLMAKYTGRRYTHSF